MNENHAQALQQFVKARTEQQIPHCVRNDNHKDGCSWTGRGFGEPDRGPAGGASQNEREMFRFAPRLGSGQAT